MKTIILEMDKNHSITSVTMDVTFFTIRLVTVGIISGLF